MKESNNLFNSDTFTSNISLVSSYTGFLGSKFAYETIDTFTLSAKLSLTTLMVNDSCAPLSSVINKVFNPVLRLRISTLNKSLIFSILKTSVPSILILSTDSSIQAI